MSHSRLALSGWMMFALSGLFFLVPAIRSGDVWALGAAITWLIGVGLFLLDARDVD